MKSLIKLITPCIALLLLVGASTAHAQGKIATVDLSKLFDNYWKTKQAKEALNETGAQYEKENKALLEQMEKDQNDLKALIAAATDSALSDSEREKKKAEAEKKQASLNDQKETIVKFQNQARARIDEQKNRVRNNILAELRKAVDARARAGGYSLVVDSAAESINNTPIVLYSTGENDLTQSVLEQLNSSAPPEATVKPADEKPKK
jgi:Skp family chaperone for outer membrane proteins